jgi:hypothetical protein
MPFFFASIVKSLCKMIMAELGEREVRAQTAVGCDGYSAEVEWRGLRVPIREIPDDLPSVARAFAFAMKSKCKRSPVVVVALPLLNEDRCFVHAEDGLSARMTVNNGQAVFDIAFLKA